MALRMILLVLGITATGCASHDVTKVDMDTTRVSDTKFLTVKTGRIAFTDSLGRGPLVVCIPGMGDTREQFRLIAPMLVASGFRVVTVDPRGQGESDATFEDYSVNAIGDDLTSLLDHLGVDAYLMGNSSGAAAAAWAAANRPAKVKGLIFLTGFLRDQPMGFFNRLMLQVALRGPWASASWVSYYQGLFITHPPSDQSAYAAVLKESLNQPGHIFALRQMVFASKSKVEKRLGEIAAPVMAVGGEKDPDFSNPEAELDWILTQVKGEKSMVDGAGHYPHLEYPEKVASIVREFVALHSAKK